MRWRRLSRRLHRTARLPHNHEMDHDTLDRLRQTSAAWRLLAADHAPLVLSFLALAFIQPNRWAIPAPELTAQLDAYLDQLSETHGA